MEGSASAIVRVTVFGRDPTTARTQKTNGLNRRLRRFSGPFWGGRGGPVTGSPW